MTTLQKERSSNLRTQASSDTHEEHKCSSQPKGAAWRIITGQEEQFLTPLETKSHPSLSEDALLVWWLKTALEHFSTEMYEILRASAGASGTGGLPSVTQAEQIYHLWHVAGGGEGQCKPRQQRYPHRIFLQAPQVLLQRSVKWGSVSSSYCTASQPPSQELGKQQEELLFPNLSNLLLINHKPTLMKLSRPLLSRRLVWKGIDALQAKPSILISEKNHLFLLKLI